MCSSVWICCGKKLDSQKNNFIAFFGPDVSYCSGRRLFTLERETDDERILVLARENDQAAFAVIVQRYQAMVFSIGYHFLGNAALAEEIAQDVFLDLYRNLRKIESASHLQAWLRRSAIHRCIDQSRSSAYRQEIALDSISEPGQEEQRRDTMADESVQRHLSRLSETQRAVLILRYQEDLEPAEIAKLLQMPVNTVKSYLQRGLKLLRQKMEWKQEART